MTALPASSVTTTSWVGAIGVSPASTTKVTSAESSARATAVRPSERASHPEAGAAAALTSSAVAAWPTLVMKSSRPNGIAYPARWDGPSPRSDAWNAPVQ